MDVTPAQEPSFIPVDEKITSGGSTIEAQQMVRRVKTYTILDSEFNSLAATTLAANLFLFFSTMCFSIGIDCMISKMAITTGDALSPQQSAFFDYVPKASFWVGGIFFLLTVGCWIFGYSTFRNIKKTSREGKLIA
ncbi:hypothetical protein [Candidatus Binatus sp.]|uniref:hypothetical protein n=1 Tax=Candidatus Binatus sp. TaxID=2811406 RepID=UPI003C9285B2